MSAPKSLEDLQPAKEVVLLLVDPWSEIVDVGVVVERDSADRVPAYRVRSFLVELIERERKAAFEAGRRSAERSG